MKIKELASGNLGNEKKKNKKNNSYWVYGIIVIILTTILFIQYLKVPKISNVVSASLQESVVTIQDAADTQKKSTRQAIDDAVNKALIGESLTNTETKTPDTQVITDTPGLSSITTKIQDKIGDIKSDANKNASNVSSSKIQIKEAISSNKIKLIYNGALRTVRLIGVSPNGKKEKLQQLLDNAKNELQIELDTKKNDGVFLLVYLWDGEPSDVKNMINIQMIKDTSSICTYNSGSGIIEQPNIKYFGDFLDATKD